MSGIPDPVDDVGEREREFWDEHVPKLERDARALQPRPRAEHEGDARRRRAAAGNEGPGLRLRGRGDGQLPRPAWSAGDGDRHQPRIGPPGRRAGSRGGQLDRVLAGELREGTFPEESFDVVVGRYALHHVEIPVIAPILNGLLRPGGRGAILETMGLNPLLNIARERMAGRAGVASYGSDDERPLDRGDLKVLRETFGSVELSIGEMRFLRIFDRNVLRFQKPAMARALGRIDDGLARMGLGVLSYHQIVSVSKREI